MDNRIIAGLILATLFLSGCGCRDEDVAAAAGDTSGLTDALTDDTACTADCLGKDCGDDGCGGTCGECSDGKECTDFGQCACIPDCEEKACGSDGCGGVCGDCGIGHVCDAGECLICEPNCEGLACGDDGCGGSCGECPFGFCKQGGCTVECDDLCQELECGPAGPDDACDCGKCKADHICQDGLCVEVVCEPDCTDKQCGPDGCEGTCGECPGKQDSCMEGSCVCLPECGDKECGDDGCGGTCGVCPGGQDACVEGTCVCQPDCQGNQCGADGCAGSCGECLGLQDACVNGACICQPNCIGKICGFDGCGGLCGECPGLQEVCAEGACICQPNCAGKTCGIDGCGGNCGECPGLHDVCAEGACVCLPNCEDIACGDAGCGFSCGECPGEQDACLDGTCICQPECGDKVCGGDGCGGSCGECPGDQDACVEGACVCISKCGDTECGDIGESGADCKFQGVCAEGGVTATCIEILGEYFWVCLFDEVVGYDGHVETTCDGKDNDCDGLIDEGLDWEASNACTKEGVCDSQLLSAACMGIDGWYCLYDDLIDEYEAEETLCDQLDNDCDGNTDELSCDICEPCDDATYCMTGFCSLVPGGNEAYCSYSGAYCVYINPYVDECDFAQTGEAACADEKSAVLCGNGTWFDKATCSGANPVCWEGNCRVCVPGSKSCDGNNVKTCNQQGTGWLVVKICGLGTICIGAGTCVVNLEFEVSTGNLSSQQSISVDPKVASSVGGGFAVVYTARSFPGGSQTDVLWRRYTSQIGPVGIMEELVNEVVSGDQNNADIDNFPRDEGGYVVVWQDTHGPGEDTSEWDIVAQILPEAGPAALPDTDTRILVNTTTEGNQTSPTVVAMADGTFMIAWEHVHNGNNDPDIYAQRFSPDGSKFGDEFLVNSFVPSDQRHPALTRLANTGVIAVWSSSGQENSWDIFSQQFNKSFVKNGAEQLTNKFTNSVQSFPAVAGFGAVKAGAYVATWESFGKDAGSLGIVVNLFDKNGSAVYPNDTVANELVQFGPQRDPAVAVLEDNHFVVVWETQGLDADDDLEGIAAKVYESNGIELTVNEFLVNEEVGGKQVNADIAAIPGNGYVVVWFSNPGGDDYRIKGRVFKVE
jgi:hypothetical protein